MKPYLILFVAYPCLVSCHSAKRINIENRTTDEAEITWVLKADSIHESHLYLSNSDTVRFYLTNKAPDNKLKLSVGKGSWTPGELSNFVDDLKYMKLKWTGNFIKLDSAQDIKDFLRLRRKGIDNSQINIVLK